MKVGDLVQHKWNGRDFGYGIVLSFEASLIHRGTIARLTWFKDGKRQELCYSRNHLEVINESR